MTGAEYIPYGRQLIDDDDVAAVAAVLNGDWLTTGPASKWHQTMQTWLTQCQAVILRLKFYRLVQY
jgi:dTDP-4-amino-4,6-dideoxygalactose transaminase